MLHHEVLAVEFMLMMAENGHIVCKATYICLVKHIMLPVNNASLLKLRNLRSFQILL